MKLENSPTAEKYRLYFSGNINTGPVVFFLLMGRTPQKNTTPKNIILIFFVNKTLQEVFIDTGPAVVLS